MKKSVLVKGILLLLVLSVFIVGFTGCGIVIIPTTGTVVIYIAGPYTGYNYNIYLDGGTYLGTTWGGTFTATYITPGWHTFKAIDSTWNSYWDEDSVYVTAGGTRYLTLYPW